MLDIQSAAAAPTPGSTSPARRGSTEYLADFYGEIADGVNDPETDRLPTTWDLPEFGNVSAHVS